MKTLDFAMRFTIYLFRKMNCVLNLGIQYCRQSGVIPCAHKVFAYIRFIFDGAETPCVPIARCIPYKR